MLYNYSMQADETVKKILEGEQAIRKELSKLSGDTLTIMSRNHEIASSYVQDAIEKTQSKQLTAEHLQTVVDEIQTLAKAILEERSRK